MKPKENQTPRVDALRIANLKTPAVDACGAALVLANQLELECAALRKAMEQVNWIVNDNGELGVEVGGRCFFLYKGQSLEYENGTHDDGTPILFRRVGKREFGETCCPAKYWLNPKVPMPDRYKEECIYAPGLSDEPTANPDYQWKPIPARAALVEPIRQTE